MNPGKLDKYWISQFLLPTPGKGPFYVCPSKHSDTC